ncbi:molecular chaperone GroES [bacterium SM23_57]|nr:MAG: molecular chaperone GroES [bacterium SM23_57]
MNIRPVDERVLVKPLEEEEKVVGGIIIPDTAKERPQIGEVVAMGDDVPKKDGGKKLSEIVKVGDKIVYAKYGGTELKWQNENYLIVSRGDILAVVTK